ncbi:TetR/AcrR family transcriptional regulator [Azospirillum halopraeferens]|uniref:TetR/AcrR family transcriptional regulator n=1 Tax=Azospirillum halopraeferens TaxID=34010 RepID=UPI0004052AA5|nr:TetR/AcrR family transcriptional regulator [Azospirillum halopraeferens]
MPATKAAAAPGSAPGPGSADATVAPDAARPVRHRRSAEATRARILEAAHREFAAKGFEGARIDVIADTAEANKRMIYQYFGDKEGLYVAVLEMAYDRARSAERRLDLKRLKPDAAMRRLVAFTFDSFVEDRSFIQLLNTENMMGARYLARSGAVQAMHSPLFGMIADILERGATEGSIRADVDPAQLWISIVGLSYFYFSNIHTLSLVTGQALESPDALAARRDHVVGLIMDYLQPAARPSR